MHIMENEEITEHNRMKSVRERIYTNKKKKELNSSERERKINSICTNKIYEIRRARESLFAR